MNMNPKDELGKFGEGFACNYLRQHGYQILCRNFRCRMGEIDIIAEKNAVLCFVEVKTRASTRFGKPSEAVTWTKQKKIYRCAEYYMQVRGIIQNMPVLSFDVIEILKEGTVVKEFHHYPHCF